MFGPKRITFIFLLVALVLITPVLRVQEAGQSAKNSRADQIDRMLREPAGLNAVRLGSAQSQDSIDGEYVGAFEFEKELVYIRVQFKTEARAETRLTRG